nr:MAG TPA: hypothetical protein [Caudoviricetes sp.]
MRLTSLSLLLPDLLFLPHLLTSSLCFNYTTFEEFCQAFFYNILIFSCNILF